MDLQAKVKRGALHLKSITQDVITSISKQKEWHELFWDEHVKPTELFTTQHAFIRALSQKITRERKGPYKKRARDEEEVEEA